MTPVRFTTAQDGLSLAWTRSGSGIPMVKAAAWLTHLEYDRESPIWSHWVKFLEGNFDYLRYDERGCGLSDRKVGRLDVETWTDDLERIVRAAEFPKPFVLLAMSQGTAAAVNYAARHKDDVSHLILLGGYARGVHHRGNPEAARFYDAIVDVFRMGWDSKNHAFREVFTKRFMPTGHAEKIGWFNELCQRATTPEIGAELLRARGHMDASDVLEQLSCPTLILHAEGDQVAPLEEGRFLARRIPNSQFVVLPSENHILQEDEPSWQLFCDQILEFVGHRPLNQESTLTPREADILAGICQAKSNKEIALDLGISDKTVRNQVTRIFSKLGVGTRQEAILKTRGR